MKQIKTLMLAALGVAAISISSCKKDDPIEENLSTAEWVNTGYLGTTYQSGEYIDYLIVKMITDDFGNTYATGYFKAQITIDENGNTIHLQPDGSYAGLLVKLGTNGETIWARSMASSHGVEIYDMKLAPTGDLILVGKAERDIVLNQNTSGFSLYANGDFLVSFSPDGAVNWGISDDRGFNFSVGTSDDYLTIFQSDEFYSEGAIIKYDYSGTELSRYSFSAPKSEDPMIALDANSKGEVLIAGNYWNTFDIWGEQGDTTSFYNEYPLSNSSNYVVKYDANSNVIFKGEVSEKVQQVTLLENGDFLLQGRHSGGKDIDPTEGIVEAQKYGSYWEHWLTYVNADGTHRWSSTFSGGNIELGDLMFHDGAFYLGGRTDSPLRASNNGQAAQTVTENPEYNPLGFVLKFDQITGSVQGLSNGKGQVYFMGISFDNQGDIILAGQSRTLDVDLGLGGNIHEDSLTYKEPIFFIKDQNPF